ncbi:MAG: methionine--tRNA ligase [Eubacteriales bacterium]|nr:methionine--tRNA ligase [Eubacteriales bacterium]
MNGKKFYITTAIAYTSRVPHIGNTYEAVLADAIARFRRSQGYDVYFLTGTDEHGQKIQDQAREEGQTPQQHVDAIAGEIRRIWDFMNVSYDQFIRTTDPKHMATVQKIFKKLYDQGDIYKGSYEGYYCKPCESFFTETQVKDGCCPDCGAKVERASEEAYFFRMSKYAPALEQYILDHPDFIQPESRKNEMLNNFIRPGLQDLCVSRTSFDWGIPVSFDERHVVYVWIDALSNYITALGYDPDGASGELFNHYWPADVHLIGKDILRFHTIYWPIMLMALGVELPHQVFGHPWMLFGEDKMSKSKGNVVYAEQVVKLFGVDATRYYMLREMPFASDGSFTYEQILTRYNGDLANILGNLVSRTHAMTLKYFGGTVPAPGEAAELDAELRAAAEHARDAAVEDMETLHVADALDDIWTLLRRTNKYIDETMPWALAKSEENRPRLASVIYNLIEAIRVAASLLEPFLPETASRIRAQYNLPAEPIETLVWGGLVPGTVLGEASALFARIDEKALAEQVSLTAPKTEPPKTEPAKAEPAKSEPAKTEKAPEKAPAPEGVAQIGIEDFAKVSLRTAKVTACEPVPKAKKLLKLTLDDGADGRTVVSGIAPWYRPEDLVGHTVIIVANLKPAVLRGVESQGMILAADAGENDVRVIFADGIPAGSEIH